MNAWQGEGLIIYERCKSTSFCNCTWIAHLKCVILILGNRYYWPRLLLFQEVLLQKVNPVFFSIFFELLREFGVRISVLSLLALDWTESNKMTR